MKFRPNRFLQGTLVLCFAAALSSAAHASEGVFSSGALTSDTQSGVSSAKTYTALANIGSANSNVVVNGATFAPGTTATAGTGWTLGNAASSYTNDGKKVTNFTGQNIAELFHHFQYGGATETITLDGLTPGKTYVSTVYCQDFGWAATTGGRGQRVSGSEGGATLFDEDLLEASMLRYTFVASGTSMTLSAAASGSGSTLHLYGLSNEEVATKAWASGTDWTSATWSPTGAPNAVAVAASLSAQGAPTTLNLDASQTVGHLQIDGANAWTLSSSNGSSLTLQTDAAGVSTLYTPSGSHLVSTNLVLANDAVKTGAGTLTLGGTISGAFGLTISNGVLKFGQSGIATHTGNTHVRTGTTLDLNDTTQTIASLIGGGTVLNNGSAAKVLTLGSGTFTGVITDHTTGTGSLSLTKTSSGKVTLSAPQTYSGATVINDGTLRLEGSGKPILTDNFNAAGTTDTNDLNFNIANRQTGSAGQQTWTKTGSNAQDGNPTDVRAPYGTFGEYQLVSNTTTGLAGLPFSATNVQGPLKISFDMFKGPNSGDLTSWTSFAFRGAATSGQPNTVGAAEVGFLYRRNSGIQIFSGSGTPLVNLTSTTAGDNFAFYLTDYSTLDSPWSGNGSRLIVTQGGGVIANLQLSGGMANRFINFGGGTGGLDNLAVNTRQANILPASNDISLTTATAVLELENTSQTVNSISGVSGSTISIGPVSTLNVAGSGVSTFPGVVAGALGGITKSGTGTLNLTGTNTYTGATVLASGILNAASITDFDVPGALGSRAVETTGTGDVGILFRGGTLQYTGSTPQSTNRGIRISINGGAIIDASGSDPSATLSFTANASANFYELGGSRQLTLTGTNTGANTFHMAITETGGQTSLNKTGPGTWVLTGANTYTGDTTVTGGVLSVNGSSISDKGKLIITGGKIDLASSVNEVVTQLVIGTTTMPSGTYGSSDSLADHVDDVHFSGAGILTVGTAFEQYASVIGDPTMRGKTADPDGDGLTNYQEFLFGLSPIVANGSLIKTDFSSSTGFVLSWQQRGDATYVLQESTDLVNWTTSSIAPTNASDQAHNYSADYVNRKATVGYTTVKKFYRVQVTANP